ncbi:MAG: VPLPA-CTERM sorting domain-containing protein [Desulfobacula sp.]|uniref:VPLPA-CTERM sorting domain-containing protein n=1 Tax=Desulfobacula sp. TaxID=2593537 RepID=UPI0025C5C25E|nr:VPLPA-CTERM sorting domain-containing protein [Desulfobacula sp.]MCD4719834.1 VPLPA-CTERM sorting domain-containing protein [Desulfobacula sp.]
MKIKLFAILTFLIIFSMGTASAGPYTGDGIAGFVGSDVNPVFNGWATGYQNYNPAPGVSAGWQQPGQTLGPVTGSNVDIASLGDLNQDQIDAWLADPQNNPGPGEITLTFETPIINGSGYDFAVFENGFMSGSGLFAELGYVDVSTDGNNFARFNSVSLTSGPVGGYGTIDPTDVHNLAGKHPNAYGTSEGTGFDLEELLLNDMVLAGLVDLNDINYVRIVDIPGSGDFLDSLGNPIYDAWVTWGSGGVDLEAVGVINSVPVPGALWLLGSGLFGLVVIRRKK